MTFLYNSYIKRYSNELFLEYLKEDFDTDLTPLLIEILTKNKSIKLDSEYINDYYGDNRANEDNIWKFGKDSVIKNLKDDMADFCTDICDKIKQIEGVESAVIKRSQSVGMSTYITVKFIKPTKDDPKIAPYIANDPKFLSHYLSGFGQGGGYEGEYKLKFRISNHEVVHATDADIEVDVLNKKFKQFEKEVVDMVNKRKRQLDSYLNDYIRTEKISPKQLKRNQERKARKAAYNEILGVNKYNRKSLTESYKESFGSDRLDTMLYSDTKDYLRLANISVDNVLDIAETYVKVGSIEYTTFLNIVADCLNKYVIDYTYDDSFDSVAFVADLRKAVNGNKLNINHSNKQLVTASYKRQRNITNKLNGKFTNESKDYMNLEFEYAYRLYNEMTDENTFVISQNKNEAIKYGKKLVSIYDNSDEKELDYEIENFYNTLPKNVIVTDPEYWAEHKDNFANYWTLEDNNNDASYEVQIVGTYFNRF